MNSHSKRKRVFRLSISNFHLSFRLPPSRIRLWILYLNASTWYRCSSPWIYIIFSIFFLFFSQTCLSTKRLKIYACDWITTLSEQQLHCRQTLKNSFLSIVFFFHFQRLFVVKQALVTGHFTLNLYWPLMRTILESGPEVSAYERLF